MTFDLIVFTVATGLDAELAINTVRIPTYEALARHLRGRGRVVVVTSCVTTLPEFLSLCTSPASLRRRMRHQGLGERSENLFTYTPVFPWSTFVMERLPAAVGSMLNRILRRGLQSALRQIGADSQRRVLWIGDPSLHFVPEVVPHSSVVYECLDDFAGYGWETNPNRVLERERKLVRKADVVFTTARALYDRMSDLHQNVHYFPNAVDFEFFNQATLGSTPVAPALEGIRRPIVGFMGNLTAWYDFGLLRSLIEAQPDWSFVFIGWADSRPEVEYIRQRPNTHFLGTRKFEELPSFLKGFDAAIMPYALDAGKTVNPDKMYQYMAAGVPVVSTPIPEVARYSGVIELASDADSFAQALQKCLYQVNHRMVESQVDIARDETWDKRVGAQLEIISNALASCCR